MQYRKPVIPYVGEIPRWIYNHWILYYTSVLLPLIYFVLLLFCSYFPHVRTAILMIVPLSIFTVLPVIDHLTKDVFIEYIDPKASNKAPPQKDDDGSWFVMYKSALYIFTLVMVSLFVYTLHYVKSMNLFGLDFWLICFNNGILMTFSMGIAHELYHKRALLDKCCGLILLTLNSYTHFWIQHTEGHHKWVATEQDPNTAHYNETIYEFIPRSVFGGIKNAWTLEMERLERKGCSFFSFRNRMLWITGVVILLPLCIYKIFGTTTLIMYAIQASIATIFSEIINYIEHYGLQRKKINGVYEAVGYQHSWDAPYRLSCYLGSNILLHADHHCHALKEYEKLSAIAGAPIMPHTYVTMVLISFIPSLFRSHVHPILKQLE